MFLLPIFSCAILIFVIAEELPLIQFFNDIKDIEVKGVSLFEDDVLEGEIEQSEHEKVGKVEVLQASILDSARWFASKKRIKTKMFVRLCYVSLLQMIQEKWSDETSNHILLLGTPGTGKTFFLNYVAYILLSQKRDFDVIISFNGLALWVGPGDEHQLQQLQGGKIPLEFQDLLYKEHTVVLYDCTGESDCEPPEFATCKVLVTSSPDARKYKQYRKDQCQTFYMPLWTFEELELCRVHCFPTVSEETFHDNFNIWGGVARYTIGSAAHSAKINLQEALGSMNFSAAEQIVKRWQALYLEDAVVCHRLIHAQTADMAHISCTFASQYVCNEVFNHLASEEEQKCKRFLANNTDNVLAAMRGQFHESYCHRFLASQENIVVRFLTDEGEARTEETKSIKLGERVLKKFDNVSELTVTDYGVPKSKNFAAVDSVAFPNVAFSMTISEHHPTVCTGLLKLMESMAKANCHLDLLVFVVPSAIAGKFKKQKYLNAARKAYLTRLPPKVKDLQQAVLGIDYT